jgi:hypothetical protein
VGLILHNISVEVLLYIEGAMGPTVCYQPKDTCC